MAYSSIQKGLWHAIVCLFVLVVMPPFSHSPEVVLSRTEPGRQDARDSSTKASKGNEDLFAALHALVPANQGWHLSEHFVTTDDGYILRLFRLRADPYDDQRATVEADSAHGSLHLGRQGSTVTSGNSSQTAPVVLLQHALMDSSAGWVLMGPQRSLAFMLAKQGFDVWMGNVRGNRFSRNHTHLDPDLDAAFWAFSWDEHAAKDLPAMVHGVLSFTGAVTLQYIGYSQGTAMALAALSSQPQLSSLISLAALLAPVSFVGHITSVPFTTLAHLQTAELFRRFGMREFGPHDPGAADYYTRGCSALPWPCIKWLQFLCGANPEVNIDNALLSVLMQYLPAGTSVQNMQHWGQGVRTPGSGPTGLRMFDYGTDCPPGAHPAATSTTQAKHHSRHLLDDASQDSSNDDEPTTTTTTSAASGWEEEGVGKGRKREVAAQAVVTCNQHVYGQREPPAYDFNQITTPLALFTGGQDSLSDPADVRLLLSALPTEVVSLHHHIPEYAHLDFGLGTDAHTRLYPTVMRVLKEALPAHDRSTGAAAAAAAA